MIGYNLCILLFLNPNFLTEKGEKQLSSSCVFFFLMLHCFELVVIFTFWSLQEHNYNLACWYVLLNKFKKRTGLFLVLSVLGLFALSLLQLHLNLICVCINSVACHQGHFLVQKKKLRENNFRYSCSAELFFYSGKCIVPCTMKLML